MKEVSSAGARREHAGRLGRALLPPIVPAVIRRLRGKANAEWSYAPSWPSLGDRGWLEPAIAATQAGRLAGYRASVAAPRPLGASPEGDANGPPDYAVHNTYMSFAYAFARAALESQPVTLLDWGGGLGQYHLLARSLFPDVELSYVCHDLPQLVATGTPVANEAAFDADAARVLRSTYSLVVASSSLQYAENWQSVLSGLCAAAHPWLYVTRIPVVLGADDYVIVQRAHRHGYPTSYPGWVVNRRSLLDGVLNAGFDLVREVLIDERPLIPGAPEQPEYRGFLFRRAHARGAIA